MFPDPAGPPVDYNRFPGSYVNPFTQAIHDLLWNNPRTGQGLLQTPVAHAYANAAKYMVGDGRQALVNLLLGRSPGVQAAGNLFNPVGSQNQLRTNINQAAGIRTP